MPIGRHVSKLSGYAPSLPTPFDDLGGIDTGAFERLCAFQVSEGATALIVCSTTGEDWSLSLEEHRELVRVAVATARGIPVIAGANSNATSGAIELAKAAEKAGADAIIATVPYYNKPTQDGILAHFRSLASCCELPIIVSDNPSRCVSRLADETIARLAVDPQFIGIEDASGDVSRPCRLKRLIGERFRLLCGDDSCALPYLISGGDGCISVTSNIAPDLCRGMFFAYKQGQIGRAQRLAQPIAELTAVLLRETNPAPLKYALELLDLASAHVRLPLVEASLATKTELEAILRRTSDHYPVSLVASPNDSDRLRNYSSRSALAKLSSIGRNR
jgi:4-hydroxy-tetrahydrodipicolinate synthase